MRAGGVIRVDPGAAVFLCFFRGYNDATVVIATMRARTVLKFLLVAIGAFLDGGGYSLVMCAAFSSTCLGMTSFWIWHGVLPCE